MASLELQHEDATALNLTWSAIRNDAESMLREGPYEDLAASLEMEMEMEMEVSQLQQGLLKEVLEASILRWGNLEEALADHLAHKLSCSSVPSEERWRRLLLSCFVRGTSSLGVPIRCVIVKDLKAIKERDPACPSLGHAFLYFKGFHGVQVYRAANWLWRRGYRSMASLLQSRSSEAFGMDIHPAAEIGSGIMVDHATCVVIGETAKVGEGCTLLHSVTLGGNGKEHGDRHPKLGTNVLVGAGASILGNVNIGDSAKIGASAVVLSDIPAFATAVGCPAKVIGRAKEAKPASFLDHSCKLVDVFAQRTASLCPFRHLTPSKQGHLGPYDCVDGLSRSLGMAVPNDKSIAFFFDLDTNHDGELPEADLDKKYVGVPGKAMNCVAA